MKYYYGQNANATCFFFPVAPEIHSRLYILHHYNLMQQSILFTLKSDKSASTCVLMNCVLFRVWHSPWLMIILQHSVNTNLFHREPASVLNVRGNGGDSVHDTNQWHICSLKSIHPLVDRFATEWFISGNYVSLYIVFPLSLVVAIPVPFVGNRVQRP